MILLSNIVFKGYCIVRLCRLAIMLNHVDKFRESADLVGHEVGSDLTVAALYKFAHINGLTKKQINDLNVDGFTIIEKILDSK